MTILAGIISSRLRIGLLLLSSVLLLGTTGFSLIEGWSPLTALYTSVLIISTLGFADHRPATSAGQILTMLLISGGVGTLYYLVVGLAQNVIETQFDWGKQRRMEQQINQLRDHFIVCGFGRVGHETCHQLAQQHQRFVVIDTGPERIERIQKAGYLFVQGDAANDEVLKQAHIERARGLLTAVQSDAANVYITLSARALNPKLFIVARAATTEAEQKLTIAGANRVVSPYVMGGRGMAGMALRPDVMELVDLLVHSDDLGIWLEQHHMTASDTMLGQPLGHALAAMASRATILAIRRANGELQINPPATLILARDDTLFLLMSRTIPPSTK